jgi:hypothetical protein
MNISAMDSKCSGKKPDCRNAPVTCHLSQYGLIKWAGHGMLFSVAVWLQGTKITAFWWK